MGAHYRSIQVQTTSRDALIASVENRLRAENGRAFVGPTVNDWTGVYLHDSAPSEGFAAALASQLNTTVLDLWVHHSDIFGYDYYRGGQLIDEYSSNPDHFEKVSPADRERLKGNPEAFRELLSSGKKIGLLDSLLKAREREEFLFEENRLEKFARLLGIANTLTSYDFLAKGEWQGIQGRSKFVHIPDFTAEKAAAKATARAAAAACRTEMNRLKKAGVLCFESPMSGKNAIRHDEAVFDPADGGMLFRWDPFAWQPGKPRFLLRAKPPWTSKPEPVELPAALGRPHNLVFSRTGKWFAYFDGQLRLWNWPERKLIGDDIIRCSPVCFSHDEKLLLCRTPQEFEVFSIESRNVTMKISARTHFLAWHPAGRIIVIKPSWNQIGLVDLGTGKLTKALWWGTVSDGSNLASVSSSTSKQTGISVSQFGALDSSIVLGLSAPMSAKFSPDGRLLICATGRGLYVLEWAKVMAADRVTPPAIFAATPRAPQSPMEPRGDNDDVNFVYDVVLDESRNRLLFGGLEGAIRFFDLKTARTGVLFKPPAKDTIYRLQLSPDRAFLLCECAPPIADRNKKPNRILIWNYRLLAASAGLD